MKFLFVSCHKVTAERQQDVNLQTGVHGLVMSQMVLVVHRQATETSHQHISMLSSKTTAMELYRHVPQDKPIQDNTVSRSHGFWVISFAIAISSAARF